MVFRYLLAVLICFFFCPKSFSLEPAITAHNVQVGDPILLELTGEPAISILRLRGSKSFDDVNKGNVRFTMSLEGKVIDIKESGEVLIQHQPDFNLDAKAPRIVTVAARIDGRQIGQAPLAKPYKPIQPQGIPAELDGQIRNIQVRHSSLPRVRLNSMEGIRLCAWDMEMVEEVVKK